MRINVARRRTLVKGNLGLFNCGNVMRFLEVAMSLAIIEFNAQLGPIERKIEHIMTREHSQRAAELEGTVVRLRRRERRLRAALKSPFVRGESRHDAREELESLLSETEQIEDELLASSPINGIREIDKFDQRSDLSRLRNKDR